VHGDVLARDVFEDAVVGGRRAASVMLGLQPVNRDDDLQLGYVSPRGRNRPHGARNHLRVHAHPGHLRQQDIELTEPHERLAADDREVDRTVHLHGPQHAVDEGLTFEVREIAEHHAAAEVCVVVRVASWTTERTLAGDFNREVRAIPAQDLAPRTDDVSRFHKRRLTVTPYLSLA